MPDDRIDRIMAEFAELRAVVAEETSAARCELRSALAGLNLTGVSEGEIAALAGALDARLAAEDEPAKDG